MKILGVDPGIGKAGFGLIENKENFFYPIRYGCIKTEAKSPKSQRLKIIFDFLKKLIKKYKPDVLVLEKIFFNKNVVSALSIGEVRGIIFLAGELSKIPVFEYNPSSVKQNLTGYGRASKKEVKEMVKTFLKLENLKDLNASDALALAISHSFELKNDHKS